MSGKLIRVVVLLFLAGLSACSVVVEWPQGVGEPTTEAQWINLETYRQRIEAERGRVVVVNFWATWCEPCREEFPELIEFHRRYRDRGVSLLSVSLDDPRQRDANVKEFLAEQRPSFPVFIKTDEDDPNDFINGIDRRWSGELPATFIYDRQGRRRHALMGKQTLASLGDHVQPLL